VTPFGRQLRALRAAQGRSLAETAAALGVSSAYLSALEHGNRGRPSPELVHRACQYFNIIWDEAEELARLANLLAERIGTLEPARIEALLALLDAGPESPPDGADGA
jgi:transcriptional regulator with XRE-family HTH domain